MKEDVAGRKKREEEECGKVGDGDVDKRGRREQVAEWWVNCGAVSARRTCRHGEREDEGGERRSCGWKGRDGDGGKWNGGWRL